MDKTVARGERGRGEKGRREGRKDRLKGEGGREERREERKGREGEGGKKGQGGKKGEGGEGGRREGTLTSIVQSSSMTLMLDIISGWCMHSNASGVGLETSFDLMFHHRSSDCTHFSCGSGFHTVTELLNTSHDKTCRPNFSLHVC